MDAPGPVVAGLDLEESPPVLDEEAGYQRLPAAAAAAGYGSRLSCSVTGLDRNGGGAAWTRTAEARRGEVAVWTDRGRKGMELWKRTLPRLAEEDG
jgi:hypothetical protein